MQAELFHHYESEISYVIGMEEQHWLPHSIPRRGLQYVYEQIKDSGITSMNRLKELDNAWSAEGVIIKFDQREVLGGGDQEFAKSGLGKSGYFYYPKSCIKEKCGV